MTDFDPLTYPTAAAIPPGAYGVTPGWVPIVATGGYVPSAVDNARAEERAAIVAWLRSRAEFVDRVATPTGPYRSHIYQTIADMIERGEDRP